MSTVRDTLESKLINLKSFLRRHSREPARCDVLDSPTWTVESFCVFATQQLAPHVAAGTLDVVIDRIVSHFGLSEEDPMVRTILRRYMEMAVELLGLSPTAAAASTSTA